jgi:hypothetical protein
MENVRPIIVVGCPRSGTTMLQLMLHAHRRIAIPPETRFVLETYRRRRHLGDLRDTAIRRALARQIVTTPKTRVSDFGLDPDALVEEIVAGPPTLGSAFGIVLRAYARRFGKPRWGDKRPAYVDNLDAILRLFPDAQVVNLVRDGRDCVASLKEMVWHRGGIYEAVSGWARAVDSAAAAARRLGPGSFHEMRYEELVADPEPHLRELCRFLGEEYDPAMTAPAAVADIAVPADKTWHARTRSAVSSDRVGSWRERLEPWEIGLCEAAFGARLKARGYELSGAPRPDLAHLVRYARVAGKHAVGAARRRAVHASEGIRRTPPVAARLTPDDIEANSP